MCPCFFSFSVCVLCVCVCCVCVVCVLRVCESVHACGYSCKWKLEVDLRDHPHWLFHLVIKVRPLSQPQRSLIWLVSRKLAVGSPYLCFLKLELQVCHHTHLAFMSFLGIQQLEFCL